jgi:hypothetical protein
MGATQACRPPAHGRTRRSFLARGALLGAGTLATEFLSGGALASAASASPTNNAIALPDPPLRESDYWSFIDWLQPGMDTLWNDSQGWYTDDTRLNAMALTGHAVAALVGHQGASRKDERARRIALRICEQPPFKPLNKGQSAGSSNPHSASQDHRPGFVAKLGRPNSKQHIAIDSKIARGLYYAWRARRELALPQTTIDLIEHRINAVAHSRFFRYPNIRLNQINFGAELFSCASSITGDATLLRGDYRRHLVRFLRGSKRPTGPWKTTNLGPSYSFHRNPFQRVDGPQNIESNEYANIVLDVISYYEQARQAGMQALPSDAMRTLRAWVKRALPAYWTHSGYLNWDTGLYLQRWHLTRYWAWSCQGLLALATAHEFCSDEERGWAKHIFDRALTLYVRLCEQRGGDSREPGSTLFGVRTTFSEAPHFELARFQALAAEALMRGLGRRESSEPPPMYAFDPAIGRLTISTPAYNTAIVAVSNGAFPYGGIEPTRLFDSKQRVIGHIGGKAPAGIGVIVRDGNGGFVASSQSPRSRPQQRPPIVLTRSPRGPIKSGVHYPDRPYAGPFETIEAAGHSSANGISFATRHSFHAESIKLRWTISRTGRAHLSTDVMFPTWGRGALTAMLADGRAVGFDSSSRIPLDGVRYFVLLGTEGGYVLVPSEWPPDAVARITAPAAQASNPRPGASLAVRIAGKARWRRLGFSATLAPARDWNHAIEVAKGLGA